MDKKTDIAKTYRAKYGYEVPTRRLATIMYNDCSAFTSVENARDALRFIEGKRGEKARKYGAMPNLVRDSNPYKFPEFDKRERKIFELPKRCNNILILPDLHCPYTHTPSLNQAIEYGLNANVNTIILLGDVLDNHQISDYCSDPTRRNQAEEFAICKAMLTRFRELFPTADIFWLKGNHDIRWERYIRTRIKEVSTMNHFQLEDVLHLHEEKIVCIDDKTLVRAGNLNFHHGHHFFGRNTPMNAAKALWDKTNLEICVGHCHSHNKYEKVTVDGIKKTFILGCLSEVGMNVDYNPLVNQYRRGFAHALIGESTYDLEMILCED
jgi:predicted phosphodiesterase